VDLFRRARADDELAREMASHLALIEDEHRRRGMSADEARLAARRAMGSVALAKDLHRDARSFVWLEDLRHDLRHAARTLRRSPGFTLIAVFALGLGIGVNTTFFTLVNAICLRGLPIDSPERVMYLSTRDAQNRSGNFSYADFDDLRQRATAFEQVAGYTFTIPVVADSRQPPARVSGAFVSAGLFELLGDRPIVGRTFRADEDRPGSPPVVILGGEIWSTRYASDPGIVGETIMVNGIPTTVIGVMPRGFMFPSSADVWRPMASLPAPVRQSRAERRIAVIARLADGATPDQGRGDLSAIAASWSRDFPGTNRDVRAEMVPINEQLNPTVAQRAWIAFIVAGVLVLLVACANVANLLLMRAATRGREMAIRTSIGATRGRVVRQLLVESATLATLAGAFGVFVAWAGLRVLSGIVPPETLPYWMAFTIDGRVLAVVVAVCVFSVFVCGLPSALHVSKVDLRDTLTDSSTTRARPARRWIATLLAAEFAITLVLIAVAVSGVRSNLEARRTEFQIDPASLVTTWITLPADLYATPAARAVFFAQLESSIAGAAGIRAAAFSSAVPYGGGSQQPMTIAGRAPAGEAPLVSVVSANERYFSVLGIPMMRGRAFTGDDGRPGAEVAIVNQRFVRMFLDGQEPIGARIRVGGGETPWLEIVGVATTVRQQPIGSQPDPVVFLPFRHAPAPVTAIMVRTLGDPAGPIDTLRREVARINANLALYRVMTFEQAVREAFWNIRLSNVIIRSIALVAFVLALIGLYAVTGHTVQRWTRELSLRVALGASAGEIAWLVLRRILTQLAIGLAVGVIATQAFDRLFSDPVDRAVADIRINDPGALATIALAIVVVSVIACVVPIRRAASVDPVEALRS
jgi:predicted permease